MTEQDQAHYTYTACQLAQGTHSNPSRLDARTWNILRELGNAARLPTKRGCRGGHKQHCIPTVIGHRPIPKHTANEMHTSSQMHDNLITLKLSSNPLNCTNLALLNARSIRNKTDFITDYICEHDLEITALTETWLSDDPKDTVNTSKLTPEGCSFVHLPRSDRRGGGVGVLYKSCINMIFSRPWPASSFQCLEVMFHTPSRPLVSPGYYSFTDLHPQADAESLSERLWPSSPISSNFSQHS